MAFVSRAPRGFAIGNSGATGEDIGPGSYNSSSSSLRRTRRSNAPFSSRASREVGQLGPSSSSSEPSRAPGPGTYDTVRTDGMSEAFPNNYGARSGAVSKNAANSSFRSTVPKGHLWKSGDSSPGPGSYGSHDDWAEKVPGKGFSSRYPSAQSAQNQQQQQQGAGLRHLPKTATAPSIPAQNQSWGYTEGPGKMLQPQPPPTAGHTGKGKDIPGPGSYDSTASAINTGGSGKGTSFGLSTSKRISFTEASGSSKNPVGPGQYFRGSFGAGDASPAAAAATTWNMKKASSMFASTTTRDTFGDGRQTTRKKTNKKGSRARSASSNGPAPGSYEARSQFESQPVPEYKQFFGSTTPRGGLGARNPFIRERTHESAHLGPGSYTDPRGAITTKRSIYQTTHGAFSSTASRFHKDAKRDLPGPGQYGVDPGSLATKVATRAATRSLAGFGSTTSRFTERSRATSSSRRTRAGAKNRNPDTPGPGSYYDPDQYALGDKNPASKGKNSSSFKSAGRKFDPSRKETESIPPPGAYNASKERIESKEVWMQTEPKGAFGSTGTRFTSKRELRESADLPGPGHYAEEYAASPRAAPANSHSLANDTFGKSKRFSDMENANKRVGAKAALPGPGYYDPVDPYSTMNKRSFNITVNEDDAASVFVR